MDWQSIFVGMCILAAAAVLVLRAAQWMRGGSSCEGCSSCPSSTEPSVVSIELPDTPATNPQSQQ